MESFILSAEMKKEEIVDATGNKNVYLVLGEMGEKKEM